MNNPHNSITATTYNLLDIVLMKWKHEQGKPNSQESFAEMLDLSPSKLSTIVTSQVDDLELARRLGVERWLRLVVLYDMTQTADGKIYRLDPMTKQAERVEFLRRTVQQLTQKSDNC